MFVNEHRETSCKDRALHPTLHRMVRARILCVHSSSWRSSSWEVCLVQVLVDDLQEQCKLKMMDELSRFIKMEHHEAVKIGDMGKNLGVTPHSRAQLQQRSKTPEGRSATLGFRVYFLVEKDVPFFIFLFFKFITFFFFPFFLLFFSTRWCSLLSDLRLVWIAEKQQSVKGGRLDASKR